jgi:4-amino-4-deoxy-L-arabinose transferase-like glycosyltransferase
MPEQHRQNTDNSTPIRWALIAASSVVWVFVVYVAYYTVHKPLDISMVLAIVDKLADLTIWLALLAIATALGHRLLNRVSYDSPLEELVFATGAGLGFVGLVMVGLGLLGALSRWLLYVVAFVACVALLADLKAVGRLVRRLKRPAPASRSERLLIGYVVLVLCLSLIACLTPPLAWDSQVYHLTGPKLFVARGRITGDIDIPYLGFPSLVEMLFLAAMLLKGDIVAKLVHFTYALLTIGLLYSFARRYLQARLPLLATAIFLSVPSIVLVSTWAYVDLGLAFYTFAAFYGFVTWTKVEDRHWLVLTGVLSGFCLGVKYTAIMTPALLGFLVMWKSRKRGVAVILCNTALLWFIAAATACPWYLKNWALSGNPIYPFLFPGRYWDEYRAWWYSRWGTGLLGEPLRLLLAPWEMTIMGMEGKEGYAATIGPVLLACLPLLALLLLHRKRPRHSGTIAYATVFCAGHYLLWLYLVAQSELLWQTRLLFPIFPLLAVLAAAAVDGFAVWDVRGFSPQRFLLMTVAIALCLNALSFVVSFGGDNPLQYLLGLETRDEYLERHLGDYYRAVSYINDELPTSSKTLFLWEPRSYYCEGTCLPDSILDKFKHLVYRHRDAAGIAQHLQSEGVTHVLFHKGGFEAILAAQFDPILDEDVETLRILQEEYWEPVAHVSESYVVYRVR